MEERQALVEDQGLAEEAWLKLILQILDSQVSQIINKSSNQDKTISQQMTLKIPIFQSVTNKQLQQKKFQAEELEVEVSQPPTIRSLKISFKTLSISKMKNYKSLMINSIKTMTFSSKIWMMKISITRTLIISVMD